MVLRLVARVIQSARSNQKRTENGSVVGIGDERILVVIAIGICHEMINNSRQLFLVERNSNPKISENIFSLSTFFRIEKANLMTHFIGPLGLEDAEVIDEPPTELLDDFFVRIGGLMMLSLDEEDLLLGSAASMS